MAKQNRKPLDAGEKLELVSALQSEYEIIQTKIDHIGNFKFIVRGWLITIYSAFVFGLFSDAISESLCLPLGIFIVLIFHLLEREQIINQNKLSNRAKLIESSIYKLTLGKHWSQKKQEIIHLKTVKELFSVPRISAVLTAKPIFRIFRKDNPKPKKIVKAFIWKLDQIWQAVKWFISFYTYWLFIMLYLTTLCVHVVLNNEILSRYLLVKPEKNEQPALINIIKNDNRQLNHHSHMKDNSIERVEEEMYSLVSQIDYGDISDIDTYWESFREALIDLEIEGWDPDRTLSSAYLVETLPAQDAVGLCNLINKMKKLCDSGSNSSISDEELEKLQDLAADFEARFEKLLIELSNIPEK